MASPFDGANTLEEAVYIITRTNAGAIFQDRDTFDTIMGLVIGEFASQYPHRMPATEQEYDDAITNGIQRGMHDEVEHVLDLMVDRGDCEKIGDGYYSMMDPDARDDSWIDNLLN